VESVEELRRIIAGGISRQALDALDKLYPERSPNLRDPIDKIRYDSGQRSVVRFLRSCIDSSP
jgi:hypothetical protein